MGQVEKWKTDENTWMELTLVTRALEFIGTLSGTMMDPDLELWSLYFTLNTLMHCSAGGLPSQDRQVYPRLGLLVIFLET